MKTLIGRKKEHGIITIGLLVNIRSLLDIGLDDPQPRESQGQASTSIVDAAIKYMPQGLCCTVLESQGFGYWQIPGEDIPILL